MFTPWSELTTEAQEIYRFLEEHAVHEWEAQAAAQYLTTLGHPLKVITLNVGPKEGQCVVWLECECEDPMHVECNGEATLELPTTED